MTVMAATTAPGPTARQRLLAAADQLFYEEGIHTVGIDRVIEHAGVAKATLYSVFGSKEDLIVAYLQGRLERRQARINQALATVESPRERILAVFDVLDTYVVEPGFHGCAFMNAGAESRPGSAVETACDRSRAWTRSLFTDLVRQAGVTNPESMARQLVQVYDGAMVSARMDHDRRAAVTAKNTAAAIIDAAMTPIPTKAARSRRHL
jgi:AcrR family transcriptional regulator